ncbi:GNAT family N-acetyltransferase [Spongorhabdus nitratireducens]
MKITTTRTQLEILDAADARLMLDYHHQNRTHFAPWEPNRDEEFYTLEYWRNLLPQHAEQLQNQTAIRFAALTPDRSEVIGTCNFTGITKGAFQACFVGYSVAEKYQGQGYMPEILKAALGYVFDTVGLHRVMATYMPSNERSAAVLQKLGFQQEGLAKSYLKIAGRWEDHVLTSKINPAQ